MRKTKAKNSTDFVSNCLGWPVPHSSFIEWTGHKGPHCVVFLDRRIQTRKEAKERLMQKRKKEDKNI